MADEIFGLEPRTPLPDGWTPLEAITVVKCLDEDGDVSLVTRTTAGITDWDGAGMALALLDLFRASLKSGFAAEGAEDDGDAD